MAVITWCSSRVNTWTFFVSDLSKPSSLRVRQIEPIIFADGANQLQSLQYTYSF